MTVSPRLVARLRRIDDCVWLQGDFEDFPTTRQAIIDIGFRRSSEGKSLEDGTMCYWFHFGAVAESKDLGAKVNPDVRSKPLREAIKPSVGEETIESNRDGLRCRDDNGQEGSGEIEAKFTPLRCLVSGVWTFTISAVLLSEATFVIFLLAGIPWVAFLLYESNQRHLPLTARAIMASYFFGGFASFFFAMPCLIIYLLFV